MTASGSANPDNAAYLKPSHLLFVAKYTGRATATPSGILCSAIANAKLRPIAINYNYLFFNNKMLHRDFMDAK